MPSSDDILVEIGRDRGVPKGRVDGRRTFHADTADEAAAEVVRQACDRILMVIPLDMHEAFRLIDLARNVLNCPVVAIDPVGNPLTERCLRSAGVSEYHGGAAARAMIAQPAAPALACNRLSHLGQEGGGLCTGYDQIDEV